MWLRVALAWALAIGLHGCGTSRPENNRVVLSLAGSNTIGKTLAVELAKAWLQEDYPEAEVTIETIRTNERIVWANTPDGRLGVRISGHGTGTGFDSLATEQVDIAMASRPIKPLENARFAEGINLEDSTNYQVLALDGIAVVVHPSNPLKYISFDQLYEVFSGEISNWAALGLRSAPINVYIRDLNSGTMSYFKDNIFPEYGRKHFSPAARAYEDNDNLASAIQNDRNAIGFVGFAQAKGLRIVPVGPNEASSILPTKSSIQSRAYPIAREVYLYFRDKKSNFVNDFLTFCYTKRAEEIIVSTDFIPAHTATETR